MRKALAIATFVVAGASAIGAGAVLSFNGSDTLGDFTAELITGQNIAGTQPVTGAPFCHLLNNNVYTAPDGAVDPYSAALNGNLVYLGGGSGTGENNMTKATPSQGLAPMSKFLTNTSCVGNLAYNGNATDAAATQAGGLVVALDGLSILGSTLTVGTGACNGDASDTACSGEPAFGLASNTSFTYPTAGGGTATYTFTAWQDVLKLLYFGIVNASSGLSNSCASPARIALANHWGEVFENASCNAPGGAFGAVNMSPCAQLQHIFRRDDASGTSDIFSSLLGASGPNTTANVVNAEIGVLTVTGGSVTQQYGMGTDSFCNDFQNQSAQFKQWWPGSNPPNLLLGVAFTAFSGGNGTIGSQQPGQNVGVVPNDDQDYDPIRRPCQGGGGSVGNSGTPNPTEQVCGRATFDLMNTTVIPTADGGVTYNCGANDAGVCPGNELCYAPANTGAATASQGAFPSGQCWGGKDLAASQVQVGSNPSCANGGGNGSCPFGEPCLLDDGGAAPTGSDAGSCWGKTTVAQGSLGLLLPMVDSTIEALPSAVTPALNIQYAVTTTPNPTPGQVNKCVSFDVVRAPLIYRYSGTGVPTRTPGLCPNGDIPSGPSCTVPVDGDDDPNCLSITGTSPPLGQCSLGSGPGTANGGGQGTVDAQGCSGYGPDPGKIDIRVYNLYVYRNTGTCTGHNATTGACNAWSGNWVFAVDDSSVAPGATTSRPLFGGGYFKIHTSQDMMVPNAGSYAQGSFSSPLCAQGANTATQIGCPSICTQADMTDQIGCLVAASPCSLGYAGRHAESVSNGINVGGRTGATSGTSALATGMRVLGVPDQVTCIQNFAAAGAGASYYPISRKLYLNSTLGFQNTTTAEQALAQCENTTALINQAVTQNNFVALPTALPDGGATITGGNPFCEDFNEQMLCTQAKGYPYAGNTVTPNVNGCAGFSSFLGNGQQTTCGNGQVEEFEDCDFGTAGFASDGGINYLGDGGATNGVKVLSNGTAIPPNQGCSTICRHQ
jgi:hypothetical protein